MSKLPYLFAIYLTSLTWLYALGHPVAATLTLVWLGIGCFISFKEFVS